MEAEAQLRSLWRSGGGGATLPLSAALEAAHHRLREGYRELLLKYVAFAVEKDVGQTLWKLGHYRLIEQYRQRLRKLQTTSGTSAAEVRAAGESLGFFLVESSRFYSALLQELSSRYEVVLDGSVTYAREGAVSGDDATATSSHPAFLACHRCLVILGDLARYRKDATNSSSWAVEAVDYYKRAVRIWSENGNAHNQLAVVATHNGDDLEAAYRYVRAINTSLPFPTASDNLAVLYQKIRQSPVDPTPPTLPAITLVSKFLLLQASVGSTSVYGALIVVFSAPERYDELWKAYLRQVRTVELGVSPLTDRVLYCMVTISTYSVGDLIDKRRKDDTALVQALDLMLHLVEALLAAAATLDARFELLPAVGRFLGWASARIHAGQTHLLDRLSSRDSLCDSLLRLAKARNSTASTGKATWPSYWEDEELRSAFAIDLSHTEQPSMHVALAALRLHQSLRPHLIDCQEVSAPPPPPPEAAAEGDNHGHHRHHHREMATAAVGVASRPSSDRGTSPTNTNPAPAMELSPPIEPAAKASTAPTPKSAARASVPKASAGVKRPRDASEEEPDEGEELGESRGRPAVTEKPIELALRPSPSAKKARKATLILQRPFVQAGSLCAAQADWRAPVLTTDLSAIELLGSSSQSQSQLAAVGPATTTLPASSNPFLPRAPSRKLLDK